MDEVQRQVRAARERAIVIEFLYAAAEYGNVLGVQTFLTDLCPSSAEVGTAVLRAAGKGHKEVITLLIECVSKRNERLSMQEIYMAIVRAKLSRQTEVVKILYEYAAAIGTEIHDLTIDSAINALIVANGGTINAKAE